MRFHAFGHDTRFHPDEALFSTFARAAALNGDWLLPGALDKPPLSIYTSAVFMALLARDDITPGLPDLTPQMGEFAARFPNTLASIVTVALVYALARRLYNKQTTLAAMLLLALSPFAVAFSATAFTDGFMLLWMLAALWLAAQKRPALAGVCLALGVASKQQALFYAPLALALLWALDDRFSLRHVVRFAVPLFAGLALLLVWDAARAQPTGMFALAAQNNDPFRIIRANELLPRLNAWFAHGAWLLGAVPFTAILVSLGVASVGAGIVRRTRGRGALVDIVLLAYALVYFLMHWLVAFNTYDRYLLPLLPPLALLSARGLGWLMQSLSHSRKGWSRPVLLFLCFAVLSVALFVTAWGAGQIPVGGDRGEHDGIDALAKQLNTHSLGAIIYDHWLGWELGYYMGQWTDKRRVYYPSPESLAEDAVRQQDPAPRYFVAPAEEHIDRWLNALRHAGFTVSPLYETAAFLVYELLPPAR